MNLGGNLGGNLGMSATTGLGLDEMDGMRA
jgi:hypothetical protein